MLNFKPRTIARWAVVAAMSSAIAAHAQLVPLPQNVVVLNASASVDVNKDWLSVTFSTSRDGADAAAVQSQLKLALDAALAEARKVAKPGQVEVQTGALSIFPRYAPPNPKPAAAAQPGGIAGWLGSVELIVEGRDTQTIAALTSKVTTLSIARVGSSLSREARQKVEGDVTAQAIERFRARADAVSRQFGFAGYTVREVSVSSEMPQPTSAPYMRQMAMKSSVGDEPLPVEAGKATVTVTVGGSVQMK